MFNKALRGATSLGPISRTAGQARRFQAQAGCGTLVLVRHGESEWNASKRFSGWADVGLTERGQAEARALGTVLQRSFGASGFCEAHTSRLRRASDTLALVLEAFDAATAPPAESGVSRTWRLNERHYGALTGQSKDEAAAKHGAAQLAQWRRGYTVKPPPMTQDHPCFDEIFRTGRCVLRYTPSLLRPPLHRCCARRLTPPPPPLHYRYDDVPEADLPTMESLEMCEARCGHYFDKHILPSAASGRTVLVAAHNNVMRTLANRLEGLGEAALAQLEIPTGGALVYSIAPEGRHVGERELIVGDL